MSRQWLVKPLSQVVGLRRGFDLPNALRVDGPYPILSAGAQIGTHEEAKVKGPGFAVGRATNLGVPQWSDTDFWPLNTTLYAEDYKGNDPRWLYRLFQTVDLSGFDSGSVQPMLNRNYIAQVPVAVPPIAVQRAIAKVLGALDDKIAANRRVVDTADTLRATLWQRLCRDSEPLPLSDIARFVNGRAFTKDATGTGRVVVRIAELNSGLSGSTVRNDIDVADDNLARPGDFLMAWSGSLTAARWFRDEAIVNQHIFKVIPTGSRSMWSVACAVDSKMADFRHEAAGKATTMGHIQRRHLDEPVLWPVLTDGDETQGQALWERALLAERENETLTQTRDELLPLLMSGRITVKDAEKTVEEVV